MTQLTSLLWKEWREARPYLLIGLGLFLGLPLVGGVEGLVVRPGHRFELVASPWVTTLGGVLAVLVAVGVTTPDLRPKVADFWRSRPVGVAAWLAAKYGVALAVVLVVCAVPLWAEMALALRPDRASGVDLVFLPFFWTAVFSLAFLAGCLVDRPTHAAALAVSMLLLAYLLPVVLPPLAWLSVTDLDARWAWDGWRTFGHARPAVFAGGMLAISAAAVAVAVVGVRRGWRIESGRKLFYGLIAAALLLLFTSAAFQLGSNLPVEQVVALPADEVVGQVVLKGVDGYVQSQRKGFDPRGESMADYYARNLRRSIHVGPAGIELGPPLMANDPRIVPLMESVDPNSNGFFYWAEAIDGPRKDTSALVLRIYDGLSDKPLRSFPLWDCRPGVEMGANTTLLRNTLYVYDRTRLRVYDVARPLQPRLVSDGPHEVGPVFGNGNFDDDPQTLRVPLRQFPGMSPQDRLAETVGRWGFDGRTLCLWPRHAMFVAYRLVDLNDRTATFERVGGYTPTPLQRLVQGGTTRAWSQGDLIYLQDFATVATFNSAITVLDARGTGPLRRVGHFAAPGASCVVPLPDGRAIVGGRNKLWLVGAPANRSGG